MTKEDLFVHLSYRFDDATRGIIESYRWLINNAISPFGFSTVPLNGKRTLTFPTVCASCLSKTGEGYKISDSRLVKETTYERTHETFSVDVPLCPACRERFESFRLEIPKEVKKTRSRNFRTGFLAFLIICASVLAALSPVVVGVSSSYLAAVPKSLEKPLIIVFLLVIPVIAGNVAKHRIASRNAELSRKKPMSIPEDVIKAASFAFIELDKEIHFANEEYARQFKEANGL